MVDKTIGFAICGSFCTHARALSALERLVGRCGQVVPIVSEITAVTDTRFGTARSLLNTVEGLCGSPPICTIARAEPIGPKRLLDALIIAPCTGNTLSKLAAGITDSCVTMAAKAHLRNDRPVILCLASNDGLSGSAPALGRLLGRKNIFFVPFGQDDALHKPTSLIADFDRLEATVQAALEGRQLQPLLLG